MSDWKAGAIKRRDARATKTPEQPVKPGPARKNTKRWCRGKPGVEHKPVCRDYSEVKGSVIVGDRVLGVHKGWKLLVCTQCGKELERYYPWGHDKKSPPAWVTDAAPAV